MDWSKLPDIVAIGVLASAFASVAQQNYTRVSGIWLTGWLLILLHFGAFLFLPAPGVVGFLATLFGTAFLLWAGVLFMWSCVPYRHRTSSRWMLLTIIATNTLYLYALDAGTSPRLLNFASILLAVAPLAVMLISIRRVNHVLRWITVTLYCGLSAFLFVIQHQPGIGADLALDALLFTVYFDSSIHFWYGNRRATTGSFIAILGFFVWSLVFVASPVMYVYFPSVHVESEVWNLPKYVVAVGMILLLLEEQVEHNKHLALHDVLTGLPNRRLFQDRLASALERARGSGTHAALLVLDLNHFKQVNDSMGHHVGDLLLQRVARLFNDRMRRSDTVARTGGDEFSVVLEGPTSETEAVHVGHALLDLLKDPLQLEGRAVRIGASLGIAVYPDDAAEMEALCIAADLRMYENKRAGLIPGRSNLSPLQNEKSSSRTSGKDFYS